jgi:hypothetical protein
MSSTPLISCSIGAATVSATVSAEAPGYCAATVTVGGTMSGYWLIGRPTKASAPTMVMITAMTPAKIGRSMKNRESRMSCAPFWGGSPALAGPRLSKYLRHPADAGTHLPRVRQEERTGDGFPRPRE